jgi:hypothetical protein
MPISTVIFFVAMYLSSVLVGAMEIGEIHVAIVKSFIILFAVNLVSLAPFGGFISLVVWLVGLMTLFRLDLWEARMLLFINWVLNFGLRFFVFAAFVGYMTHGGGMPHIHHGGSGGWTDDDIEALGGTVEYSPSSRRPEVTAISFRAAPIKDADLAHMKDFPLLIRLDLSNTPITDRGLAHLKACRGLQRLTLTNTQVTDAGVQELQQALPQLKIVR